MISSVVGLKRIFLDFLLLIKISAFTSWREIRSRTFPSVRRHTDERLLAADDVLLVCDLGRQEEALREPEGGGGVSHRELTDVSC